MYSYLAYFGTGIDFDDSDGLQQGLSGDYRQFYFSLGYVPEDKVAFLKNQ